MKLFTTNPACSLPEISSCPFACCLPKKIKISFCAIQLVIFRMLGLHLERLGEIVLAELDASFSAAPAQSLPYRGGIELKDIRFRYGDGEPYVLDGVDLTVEPGEHVAITGASGGGKSTLVKIILGLIAPETGQILIDGIDLNTFGHKNFHDYVGAVLQDDHLFAGSLAENIALFDDAPSMEAIHDAAKAAALHEDIIAMPMAYETMVGDMGSALSGGQRQRLLLARALYRHPRLIVMDEATSHLDPVREQAVVESISRLGITRIVIAHRLETILSASRVLALRQGKLEDVTAQFK